MRTADAPVLGLKNTNYINKHCRFVYIAYINLNRQKKKKRPQTHLELCRNTVNKKANVITFQN